MRKNGIVLCALSLCVGVAHGQDLVPDQQLEAALRVSRPVAGLDVTVATNHVQLNRAEYRVSVMLRVPATGELAPSRGSRMDVAATMTDSLGTTVQRLRDQIVVDADPATSVTSPTAYAASFIMLPGTYTVRFAVRDQLTGRIGTADAAFVVRNLARAAQRP